MPRDMHTSVTLPNAKRDKSCLQVSANQHRELLSQTAHYIRPAAACASSFERYQQYCTVKGKRRQQQYRVAIDSDKKTREAQRSVCQT